MTDTPVLKSPFPYCGGKSKIADAVWDRLGDVSNYCEPFAGSLAVLLRRPANHFAKGYRVETCNDLNHFVVNFFRAVKADPEGVAEHSDQPVHECDLHARHRWLIRSETAKAWRKKMLEDADYYDSKIAGWWCWGMAAWIGSGFCDDGWRRPAAEGIKMMPNIDHDKGVNCGPGFAQKIPKLGDAPRGSVEWQQRPNLDPSDHGVLGRPQLTDAYDIGRGVNASPPTGAGGPSAVATQSQKIPLLRGCGMGVNAHPTLGTCEQRRAWLTDWMRRLSDRLRLVRTCYGHWSRICDSDSTLTRLGETGVFLDPPYPSHGTDGKKSRDANLYATDKGSDLNALRDEVLAWCRKWGQDPRNRVRIIVCGYEGDGYAVLESEGWSVESWCSNGGYGNQRKGKKGKSTNAKRERLWLSPACLKPTKLPTLFDGVE